MTDIYIYIFAYLHVNVYADIQHKKYLSFTALCKI